MGDEPFANFGTLYVVKPPSIQGRIFNWGPSVEDTILLLVVGVAVAGVFGQWLGWKFRVPAIIPLLLIGAILGPIGAQWFYQGETLGYRTLYVWFAQENLMITVQTNSQPASSKLNSLVETLYRIIEREAR